MSYSYQSYPADLWVINYGADTFPRWRSDLTLIPSSILKGRSLAEGLQASDGALCHHRTVASQPLGRRHLPYMKPLVVACLLREHFEGFLTYYCIGYMPSHEWDTVKLKMEISSRDAYEPEYSGVYWFFLELESDPKFLLYIHRTDRSHVDNRLP